MFMKAIDQLPTGPEWQCELIQVHGDAEESSKARDADEDLPHFDIFTYITSNILHQLHQEIIKDHLKKWCMAIMGKKCFDSWFQATPFHLELQHWKAGIFDVKQWTDADHKQLQWVFVTMLVGTTKDYNVIRASHDALNDFHTLKDVFISLGCCEHFNIPKLHLLVHYVKSIQLFGSLDGFNTENLEWLHIDYVKKAYAATN
ncbi:hypothetical protein HD554DRAFT_2173021 [Boletus coccyginus]|nr:hypothetical protein HD554DRAFT_2173021 [Boletus coccyginus]